MLHNQFFDPQLFPLLTAIYLLYLFVICLLVWRKSKRRFSYSIMDLYAFTLGIIPTLVSLAWVSRLGDDRWYLPVAMLGLSQFTGFALGVLEKPQGMHPWAASCHVLFGTLGGMGLALLFLLVAWMAYYALVMLPVLILIAVPLSPILFFLCRSAAANSHTPDSSRSEDGDSR